MPIKPLCFTGCSQSSYMAAEIVNFTHNGVPSQRHQCDAGECNLYDLARHGIVESVLFVLKRFSSVNNALPFCRPLCLFPSLSEKQLSRVKGILLKSSTCNLLSAKQTSKTEHRKYATCCSILHFLCFLFLLTQRYCFTLIVPSFLIWIHLDFAILPLHCTPVNGFFLTFHHLSNANWSTMETSRPKLWGIKLDWKRLFFEDLESSNTILLEETIICGSRIWNLWIY